mgnify:CR=1 FL=1
MGPEDRRVPLAFEEHDARIDAEAKVQERMPAPDAFCGEGVQKGVRRAGRAFRGAEGEQVKNGSERRVIAHGEALQRAFSIDGPVLVDVVVAKEELAIPPQIKLEQAIYDKVNGKENRRMLLALLTHKPMEEITEEEAGEKLERLREKKW